MVTCLKVVDWLWGLGGWITLGTTFGAVSIAFSYIPAAILEIFKQHICFALE